MKLSKIIILIFIFITAAGGLFFIFKKDVPAPKETPAIQAAKALVSEKDPPQIVSTKPDPLEDNIVSATEIVEITFNRPLQNSGEFKLKIEPKIDFKIELSSDRKTAKITPVKPFELGVTYTIFIGPDTKFDGVANWGQDKFYHFKTVKYTGV